MKKLINRWLKKDRAKRYGLIKVHTFKDGTNLYQYPEDKIQFVAIAHEQAINEYRNFLFLLNQTMHEAKILGSKLIDIEHQKLNGGDLGKLCTDTIALINYQLGLPKQITEAESKLKELLFCMFFITENEEPYTFNEYENERKIALINEDAEAKARFFFCVNGIRQNFDKYFQSIRKDLYRGNKGANQAVSITEYKQQQDELNLSMCEHFKMHKEKLLQLSCDEYFFLYEKFVEYINELKKQKK